MPFWFPLLYIQPVFSVCEFISSLYPWCHYHNMFSCVSCFSFSHFPGTYWALSIGRFMSFSPEKLPHIYIFCSMIASHHFFCCHFLECLSIGCWTTWIDSLIFWPPLFNCPSFCLFILHRNRLQLYIPIFLLSFHFLLFFKLLTDLCVCLLPLLIQPFCLFVSWLCYVLLRLWGYWLWDGRVSSGFFLHSLFLWVSFFSCFGLFHIGHFP